MSTFRIGQDVVCVVDGTKWFKRNNYTWLERQWYILTGKRPKSKGPQFADILTVVAVGEYDRVEMLFFIEWPGQGFAANAFRPLHPLEHDDALNEQIERIEREGIPFELEPALP